MSKFLKCTAALFVLLTATEAFARGAAASIMSSPGYQRACRSPAAMSRTSRARFSRRSRRAFTPRKSVPAIDAATAIRAGKVDRLA